MNPLRILPLFILLACPVALGFVCVQEFLAVDEALDSGAAWDYVAARPDFVQSHPYMSFAQRNETFVAAASWSLAAALIYLFLLCTIFRPSIGGRLPSASKPVA
jgi:hypothetical protein